MSRVDRKYQQLTPRGGADAQQTTLPRGGRLKSLEGANCADLPGFVADKYFDCHVATEPFLARTAKAICARCVVIEECREQALNMPKLQKRGVIGGVSAIEIRRARSWRSYEQGVRLTPPQFERPDWLARPDAVEIVEQALFESDPDEA